MSSFTALGNAESMVGLPGIARLKGVQLLGDESGFSLGPTDQGSLVSCLLTWVKMHPAAASGSSVLMQQKDAAPSKALQRGLMWSGIKWSGHWSKILGKDPEGWCSWESLTWPRHSSTPPMPSPWYGRAEEASRLRRLLESNQVVVLEGQPMMGRTSFTHAFANLHCSRWVDGFEFIDLSSLDSIRDHRKISPEAMARRWQGCHKLIVLENATHQAEWLGEALSFMKSERSLCSILVLPVEEFLDKGLPRLTLSVLSNESFHELWVHHFGESPQAHRDLMKVQTGRIPGVITCLHRELGGKSPPEIEDFFDEGFTRLQPLLRMLSQRVDELTSGAANRLRVLSLLSSQFSLPMALEAFWEESTPLLEVAELLTSGWFMLEQKGYRIPRPLAMAARARLKPTDDDQLLVIRLLVKTAANLAELGRDLVPSRSSEDFTELIWASYEPLLWLKAQKDQDDLALDAAVLFWLPTLTEGYTSEFLSFTDSLAKNLEGGPATQKSAIFWEARGRHLRAAGLLAASLEAHELGIAQASQLGMERERLWNLQFKGTSLSIMGRRDEADSVYEELIPKWREHGTQKDLAHGLCSLGQHLYRNRRLGYLSETLIEAHHAARRTDEPGLLVMIKELQGWSSFNEGDYSRASMFFEEADLMGQRTLNLRRDLVSLGKALIDWQRGERDLAIQAVRAGVSSSERMERLLLFMLELNLSLMEVHSSLLEPGLERARRCYAAMLSSEAKLYLGDTLDLAALCAWRTGQASSAAILCGTAFHWQGLYGRGQQAYESGFRDWIQACRIELGDAAFQARHQAGALLDPLRLLEICRVDYSLVSQMLPELTVGTVRTSPLLSSRQLDVVRLAAQGMSNKEIAAVLFLEEGTVKRHLHNCARELGVKGRVSLARKARELGLIP